MQKNEDPKLKFRGSELDNYDAIPEITSEITNKEEKKDTIVSKESECFSEYSVKDRCLIYLHTLYLPLYTLIF